VYSLIVEDDLVSIKNCFTTQRNWNFNKEGQTIVSPGIKIEPVTDRVTNVGNNYTIRLYNFYDL